MTNANSIDRFTKLVLGGIALSTLLACHAQVQGGTDEVEKPMFPDGAYGQFIGLNRPGYRGGCLV